MSQVNVDIYAFCLEYRDKTILILFELVILSLKIIIVISNLIRA